MKQFFCLLFLLLTSTVFSQPGSFTGTNPSNGITGLFSTGYSSNSGGINLSVNVLPQNLKVNDRYFFELSYTYTTSNNNSTVSLKFDGGLFKISQYPNSLTPITPGVNDIWGYYDIVNYPNVITSSNSQGTGSLLSQYYDEVEIKQKDILGSGFNPITLPWSIKRGDEFRFEGREDLVFMVDKVYGPGEATSSRLSPPEVIEVHFDKPLLSGSLSPNFNLDHFLIRRYIDDASQIIMEGYRPINSQGPYLIRPEYVVPELNKNIDEIILDLTEKGLI